VPFDFDQPVQRRGTWSARWERYPAGVIPLWVADMDFPVAAPISSYIAQTVRDGDLGYPVNPTPDGLPTVFAKRALERFGWQVDPHRVLVITDVVQGIYLGLYTLSEPGDGVVVQTPVYPWFLKSTDELGRRRIVNSSSGAHRLRDRLRRPAREDRRAHAHPAPVQPAEPDGPRVHARRARAPRGARDRARPRRDLRRGSR
jgi:cystathionine beta-lyase